MDNYILYSNRKTDTHIFLRKDADGKETLVSSEEMKNYKRGKHYPSVMDIHHALIRFTYEQVGKPDTSEMKTIDSILRIPFDKANARSIGNGKLLLIFINQCPESEVTLLTENMASS